MIDDFVTVLIRTTLYEELSGAAACPNRRARAAHMDAKEPLLALYRHTMHAD